MRGHFEVELKDSGALRDEDFLSIPRRELNSLLDSLRIVKHVEGWNKCNDMLPASIFRGVMSGADIDYPFNNFITGYSAIGNINVEYRDPEITYTEWIYANADIHNIGYPVGTGNSGKRFIEDEITNHAIEAYQNSREEVWFRSRWLYLPSQIVCGNIRSIGYFFGYDGDADYTTSRGTYGRFRLKDSNGNPITISKSSSQVLLVQMKLVFVSV